MDSSKPQVFFLRKHDRTPIGAVAIQRANASQVHPFAKVAVSICHPSDAWNRATARNKALGRLKATDASTRFVAAPGEKLEEILYALGICLRRRAMIDFDAAQKTFDRLLDFVTR